MEIEDLENSLKTHTNCLKVAEQILREANLGGSREFSVNRVYIPVSFEDGSLYPVEIVYRFKDSPFDRMYGTTKERFLEAYNQWSFLR